ncbi:hypothetical protein [Mycolicibacterium smegmatis]|uniref:Uncharacterized protein n=2 Tax=Mycolicibacterium smegmatis (strain ATCC 700084 / mc(2)155) TaxID=246196 RepID=I7FWW6_MYCS2|nr:hypothetical protein [Mycolicibacterium smegmatis]ABK72135.1 conserved hypothetical protein [Mycolicibacterium smegmatis MC2 155]AFP37202.1 hypothetical protein MSMEI_0722 [Mycolicibacterium smegmatis MC2 155]AIU06002.1 hypothetical protein LJ00_03665 [Mycolicibacterium smegmatis MC2 155]AIU12627.1 hypothetical protein LI99_03665 [Mycolicibacterium smegmatis]AIU19251.1 hypothetical protein LI98_03665 [Mycolicibacterium smegmatis]
MRALIAVVTTLMLVVTTACSDDHTPTRTYEALTTTVGQALDILGWHITLSDLRFEADRVLVDVDATPSADQRAKPEDLRFGLYGALAHPIEATGIGACSDVPSLALQPLAASPAQNPDKLSGTVCLGPQRDQSQVRGVYVYSPRDRISGTTVAYAAAFPVGVLPTNPNDTGLSIKTTSVDGFSADGAQLAPTALGEPEAFSGNGYMLLGLEITGLAQRYRDDSAQRGGPLMVVAAPTLPPPGLSHACSVYGSSVLVLPDASREGVNMRASLCTQGEINAALLYASVSVIGTHAALWTNHG